MLRKDKPSTQRKLIAVRLDLADKISELAIRKGTLYDYVNETFEQTIKIDEMGLTLREMYDEMSIFKSARDVGFTIFPETIVMALADKSAEGDVQALSKLFFENGQWYGKYYGETLKFEEMMKKFLWTASEFKIEKSGKGVILTCLGSVFTKAYTEFLAHFLEGAMDSLGYEKASGDVSKGILRIKFNPKAK